jgi:hypothetical protein
MILCEVQSDPRVGRWWLGVQTEEYQQPEPRIKVEEHTEADIRVEATIASRVARYQSRRSLAHDPANEAIGRGG